MDARNLINIAIFDVDLIYKGPVQLSHGNQLLKLTLFTLCLF